MLTTLIIAAQVLMQMRFSRETHLDQIDIVITVIVFTRRQDSPNQTFPPRGEPTRVFTALTLVLLRVIVGTLS